MSLIKKSYEVIAEQLEKLVENGSLEPGTRLPTIDRLAEQYQVGKSTIREALSQLKARGLIESRQGEGTFVKKSASAALKAIPPIIASNHEELVKLMQVRQIVESGCAELAAMNRDEADIQRLSSIINSMEAALTDEEMSRLYDIEFHIAIAYATKNQYLQNMMESISEALNLTIRDSRNLWLYENESTTARLYHEHLEVFEAIQNQDSGEARRLIEQHLIRVRQVLETSR
ncbi:GntR family transcriptional repressor for pyruvate dehydrogenase complex [Aneurinibacillus soli]|uniref:HTH-type transcriptional regulator LutR n=1 Tax=Aneurinibacillus soli TaxID=1500254 RepID=A0A0U4NMD9_9BACL|nr:FadR/GntR family transcriptional regulator [Aneurinibacillus soli]PYE60648.1 GntR family transcriptional repressor for pyruvate dehydrogenase complex [Aneurinibacillus soli]BAU29828.1 HTH-type transcriptional regulator LutR [Aneurinibacillus soli]